MFRYIFTLQDGNQPFAARSGLDNDQTGSRLTKIGVITTLAPFVRSTGEGKAQTCKLAPSVRPTCLTLATSSDSVAGKVKPWLSRMSRFYRDKRGIKGLATPFPAPGNPRSSDGRGRSRTLSGTISLTASLRSDGCSPSAEHRSASRWNHLSPSPEFPGMAEIVPDASLHAGKTILA